MSTTPDRDSPAITMTLSRRDVIIARAALILTLAVAAPACMDGVETRADALTEVFTVFCEQASDRCGFDYYTVPECFDLIMGQVCPDGACDDDLTEAQAGAKAVCLADLETFDCWNIAWGVAPIVCSELW